MARLHRARRDAALRSCRTRRPLRPGRLAIRFERHVVVDWSASASPTTGRDSIWIADLVGDEPTVLHNPPTRRQAEKFLVDIVGDPRHRTLIAVDAGLGYPVGSAELFGLGGDPWRAVWSAIAERLHDDDRNANDRFEVAASLNALAGGADGPFWGCPSDRFGAKLRPTKPAGFPVGEYRQVERWLRSTGRHPKSCWQLLGAGSVGSQTLTLLPILHRMLDRVAVWPFTTGLRSPSREHRVVVAEVWPSMFVTEIPIGSVRDAVQVSETAAALRSADRSGALPRWFAPLVTDPGAVEGEEGWILGVNPRPARL